MAVSASVNETPVKPPKKRGPGAPVGNKNRMVHGLYSPKAKTQTSEFGNRQTNQFRRHLVELITVEHGEPSLLATALIQTATEATRAAIANREMLAKLIKSGKDVKPELKMQIDAQYLSHLDRRDKKLRELGLSVDQISGIDASSSKGQADEPRGLSAVLKILDAKSVTPSADEPREPQPPTPAGPVEQVAAVAAPVDVDILAAIDSADCDATPQGSGLDARGLLYPRW
jgi:hypothetical protein